MPHTTRLAILGVTLAAWCGLGSLGHSAERVWTSNRATARVLKEAEPFPVDTLTVEWRDAQRQRSVPVKIYSPAGNPGPFPVIIFSHGVGFTRDDYAYLGHYWAGQGYVCVHVQHRGSDIAERQGTIRPKETLRRAFEDPANTINRARDISFAIDQLQRINRDDPRLRGRLDIERLGVAGHAFGSLTALCVAGQIVRDAEGHEVSLVDNRVKAIVAMSSPVPPDKDIHDTVYRSVKVPCLHMTGTKDDSPIATTRAPDRRIPFDHIGGVDQYLVTFKDADHMVFIGHKLAALDGKAKKDAACQKEILSVSTAFWNAYLKGDQQSKAWLSEGGCSVKLAGQAVVEAKAGREAVATEPRDASRR